jgi:hypothetical protein
MECYNTTTLPHKKYYDLEKWTLKQVRNDIYNLLKRRNKFLFKLAVL